MQILPCGAPSHIELHNFMKTHTQNIDLMLERELPSDLSALISYYEQLGQGVVISEACLVAAFDALDRCSTRPLRSEHPAEIRLNIAGG